MRIAFAGTPEFAVPILEALVHDPRFQLVLVFSQPARPSGRGLSVKPGAVEVLAKHYGLPLRTPAIWDETEIAALRSSRAEVLVTAAYGILLPDAALEACPLGAVNIHGSLLPRWRGAAPIQRAIEAGDLASGITFFRITPGPVDAGPIFARFPVPIAPRETAVSLAKKLSHLAAERIGDELHAWAMGQRPEHEQDPTEVTKASKLKKEESMLSWRLAASVLDRRVRAFTPWPGTRVGTLRILELLPADPRSGQTVYVPGAVLKTRPLLVACGDGTEAVELVLVQRDGGRPLSGSEWAHGARIAIGSMLP